MDTKTQNNTPLHGMVCVVINLNGQILILKRNANKKYFPGKWAPVGAAPLTGKENMKEIALREITDELGASGTICKEYNPTPFETNGQHWIIHPFLAKIDTDNITLNDEHTEAKWITPKEIVNYDTIPGFKDEVIEFFK